MAYLDRRTRRMQKRINYLVKTTHFNAVEVTTLVQMFKKFKILRMDQEFFKDFMYSAFGMVNRHILERIFHILNVNKDGLMRVDEWVKGLSTLLLGTYEERKEFCFKVYALHENEVLNRNEIELLLKDAFDTNMGGNPDKLLEEFLDLFFSLYSTEGEMVLSKEEVHKLVDQNPAFMEAFGVCFPEPLSRTAFMATFMSKNRIKIEY